MAERKKLKASLTHDGVETIETALSTLAAKRHDPNTSMIAKEFGLGLALIGAAEVQTKRLIRLGTALEIIESELYSPDRLKLLKPLQLVALYKLSSEAMRDSGKYLADINKTLDWDRMQEHATTLDLLKERVAQEKATGGSVDDNLLIEMASGLLLQMAKQEGVVPELPKHE